MFTCHSHEHGWVNNNQEEDDPFPNYLSCRCQISIEYFYNSYFPSHDSVLGTLHIGWRFPHTWLWPAMFFKIRKWALVDICGHLWTLVNIIPVTYKRSRLKIWLTHASNRCRFRLHDVTAVRLKPKSASITGMGQPNLSRLLSFL